MKVLLAVMLMVAVLVLPGCRKKKRKVNPPAASSKMISLEGYEEEGIASWYGHPYHGRQAANGETYDMDQMTAAHRTLPFGTWVEVANLVNGKQVTVRITDRGPFIEGRIIDLSHAAAREIEMIGPGTVRVRVRVKSAPQVPAGGEHFAVQIGAFRERGRAEALAERMRSEYGKSQLVVRPGSPPLWRVLVGDEGSAEAAAGLAERIRVHERAAFVVRLDAASGGL